MRRKIIVGNWKMNKTKSESVEFCNELKNSNISDSVDVVIFPPFINIDAVSATLKDTNIKIGSQNLHHQDQGAYTGEVSANMLRDLDVTYVIIGHSERRQYNFETEEIINKKLKTAFSHDIIPILCCGENLEQREQGITIDLIRTQIKTALHSISKDEAKKIIIAYEPIWAIGTGLTASE